MSRRLPRFTRDIDLERRQLDNIIGDKPKRRSIYMPSLEPEPLEPKPLTKTQRQPMSKWLRGQIIERDGPTCYLCGLECRDDEIHIDHVVPVARGGDNHPGNLRVACRTCNIRKGKKMPTDKPRIQSKVLRNSLPLDRRSKQPVDVIYSQEKQRERSRAAQRPGRRPMGSV